MQTINRFAVVLRPLQPFVDWANSAPVRGTDDLVSPEKLRADATVVLTPEMDTVDEALLWLKRFKPQLFEMELDSWCTDRATWPEKRTAREFDLWFELEVHSIVYDAVSEPILTASQEAELAAVVQPGDSVRVRPGVVEPDTGTALSGWQGRVRQMATDPDSGALVAWVEWDSLTLKELTPGLIRRLLEADSYWDGQALETRDLLPAAPRDSQAQTDQARTELLARYTWVDLDEQGKRIHRILRDAFKAHPQFTSLEAWEAYLGGVLRFPFMARVVVEQDSGPLKLDMQVEVRELSGIDPEHGLFVMLQRGGRSFVFPLSDLAVDDPASPNFQPLEDYGMWFENK